ncbi:MAG: DUF3306 domain-containing protein [Candidatus Thioglobus sp.]|nr:MAG: DUF3306 domain-containing protein [Candidatus Thioglobus sp.]
MMSDPDEAFLGRWSRRKALKQGDVDLEPTNEPKTNEQDLDQSGDESVDPPLTDEDMPPVESLGEDDDFSGFLSPEISEKLRKAALRKLFHGAGFNVRDGLDDYDDDFTVFEPLGDIVTADMRHQQEMLERKAREAAEKEAAEKEAELVTTGDCASEDREPEPPPNEEDEKIDETPSEIQDSDTDNGVPDSELISKKELEHPVSANQLGLSKDKVDETFTQKSERLADDISDQEKKI